ncbi:phosphopyruvate hydratase, partial [Candidatus Roizmanbacteria bacterium]|nr:phosphopyruvate hydratase [Candidatus Roizmanbacteria bacterium]
MAVIKSIRAYEIINSRGEPTIEGQLVLDNNVVVTTAVPSGASVGKHEAVELRDGNPQRFNGLGVSKAISFINDLIAPKLVGASPLKQQEIDYWLIKADGTKDKSKLGANTTLTVSQLILKAGAADQGLPLYLYVNTLYKTIFKTEIKIERVPSPIFNIINGGKHGNNNLEFQEFQIVPSSSYSFTRAYQIGVELFHELKKVLLYRNAIIAVGDEGGFTPNFSTNLDAAEVLNEAITQKGFKVGLDVFLGMDIASSHFYKD